jgi:deoxycytidylate deaminase
MYMTCGISCADCARAIINSGISKIVLREGRGATNPKWQDSAKRSQQMFKEAGVIVEYYD